ncbi:hypothetical protein CK486_00685 [Pseudomonas sp. HAR-UPW-AIA-41]|uniref:hypothetical protein n=1 Tax=Pseudomonas sp. HAR-UPW-AIA-41 TaxID=1985301 RepID=UPI000BB35B9D|nr:hypothetical protein [Pseudomonas sp. HAR-UPW-AIA-41]PAV49326.1 hypothetical protein CK486_00685 [Pseudomonas sp. HAR-UPW-AIA-41]
MIEPRGMEVMGAVCGGSLNRPLSTEKKAVAIKKKVGGFIFATDDLQKSDTKCRLVEQNKPELLSVARHML